MTKQNILASLPAVPTGESVEQWLRCKNVVIERIVSSDQPEPVLYDQEQDEWVLLLQGDATLDVGGKSIDLQAGDTLFIEAHTPHRVTRTSRNPGCVWLAVHIH